MAHRHLIARQSLSHVSPALLSAMFVVGACSSANRVGSLAGDAAAENTTIGKDAGTNDATIIEPSEDAGTSGSPTTCEGAAQLRSYVGCDYWPTVLGNNVWSIFDYAVVIANGQDEDAAITIDGPNGVSVSEHVTAGSLKKIYLPWVTELKGPDLDVCSFASPIPASVIAKASAYHLTSSIPVSVYQFNAIQYSSDGEGPPGKAWSSCPGDETCLKQGPLYGQSVGCYSWSNDASLLLPSTVWTGNYRVVGRHGVSRPPPFKWLNTYFSIVAAEDGTKVDVTLPEGEVVLTGAAPQVGRTLSFTLDKGDVAQIASEPGEAHDLSGSLVKANKPVQVFAGSPCSDGGPVGDGSTCDHLEESIFPAETLGAHYVVAPPTSPVGKAGGHEVWFYGNVDGTTLTYSPLKPAGCPDSIDAGQRVACQDLVNAAFEVKGDHEFAVASFMLSSKHQQQPTGKTLGDPSLTLAVAVEQYRRDFIFLAPSDYDENWVEIVAPKGTKVKVDGLTTSVMAVPVTNDFVLLRQRLGSGQDGAHTISATQPVGVQVIGFAPYTSYAYPAGLDLKPIAPPPLK